MRQQRKKRRVWLEDYLWRRLLRSPRFWEIASHNVGLCCEFETHARLFVPPDDLGDFEALSNPETLEDWGKTARLTITDVEKACEVLRENAPEPDEDGMITIWVEKSW